MRRLEELLRAVLIGDIIGLAALIVLLLASLFAGAVLSLTSWLRPMPSADLNWR